MKCVLISIQPKWVQKILSGEKTIELRKSAPKLNPPFKCYIYSTQGLLKDIGEITQTTYKNRMHVVGEFICDELIPIHVFENGSIQDYNANSLDQSCVPYDDIAEYIGYDQVGYGWKISNLIVYEQPKKLTECISYGYLDTKYHSIWSPDIENYRVTRPPQSYMFIENMDEIAQEISHDKKFQRRTLIEEYQELADPAEQLNYYRNLHYKDPYDSESYIIAWALDKILPELVKLRNGEK